MYAKCEGLVSPAAPIEVPQVAIVGDLLLSLLGVMARFKCSVLLNAHCASTHFPFIHLVSLTTT